jgi:hypothetical protein
MLGTEQEREQEQEQEQEKSRQEQEQEQEQEIREFGRCIMLECKVTVIYF